MKIWFGCSTAEFEVYQEFYYGIRDFLIAEGHILTRDWLMINKETIDKDRKAHGTTDIYKSVINAINQADLLIIEDTVSRFSTGHQITVGLLRQKPVLVLWQESKNKHYDKSFLDGIKSDVLHLQQYQGDQYKDIIRKFIRQYQITENSLRFNLVVSQNERRYIDWVKFRRKQSRTSLIRELIRNQIGADQEYQNYLSQI